MRLKDLSGKRFGKLQVICRTSNKKKWTRFRCNCDCGKQIDAYSTHLLRGYTKSCGCGHPKGAKVYNYKGYGEITGNRWDSISKNCQRSNRRYRRSVKFQITIKFAWELFLKQERKCALSGIPLAFAKRSKESTASLDRIDSKKNYSKDNVQWVHKDINRMKNVYVQDYFIKMCLQVAKTVGDRCEIQ